jgi:hypothetical protein
MQSIAALSAPTRPGRRALQALALGILLPGAALALQAAAEPALIPIGAPWRFLAPTNEPSVPLTAWRQLDFDDSAWLSGPAAFSLSGDEATQLPAAGAATVYFRKTFQLTDPADVRWLVLRVDYVDGFAAYLNGQPVTRRGLPPDDPLPYGALATYHARGAIEEINLSEFTPLLVPGTNVLAIELHPYAVPPLWYALVPELRANFPRGPIVRNVTTNGAEIVWRTPVPADGAVEFGPTEALGSETPGSASATNHIVRLAELPPGTRCYYRVRSSADGGAAAFSPIASFRTARVAGDLTFGVFGDTGSGKVPQLQVAACLATARVDLVLHVGDVAYPVFNAAVADTRCLSIYEPHLRSTPYYFSFGNHDLYAGSDAAFLEVLGPPTNAVTGTGHFYAFDQGDAHFACLFVPLLSYPGGTAAYGLSPGSAQWQWLTNDLATSRKPWKFLYLHCPLFTSSAHRGDDYNYNGIPDRLELQSWLLPLAAQHGVQAIFTGHDHTYERFAPTNGVHCFVSGGGGYTLYGLTQFDALSVFFASRFHHLRAAVRGESLLVEAIDQFGVPFDRVIIPRGSLGLRIARGTAGKVRLTWATLPGSTYDVEEASALEGSFHPVQAPSLPRTATGPEESLELEVEPASPVARFFRVRAL